MASFDVRLVTEGRYFVDVSPDSYQIAIPLALSLKLRWKNSIKFHSSLGILLVTRLGGGVGRFSRFIHSTTCVRKESLRPFSLGWAYHGYDCSSDLHFSHGIIRKWVSSASFCGLGFWWSVQCPIPLSCWPWPLDLNYVTIPFTFINHIWPSTWVNRSWSSLLSWLAIHGLPYPEALVGAQHGWMVAQLNIFACAVSSCLILWRLHPSSDCPCSVLV